MDLLIQIIGYSFIPFLAILIASGISEIYQGLKEHYQFKGFKVTQIPFNEKTNIMVKSFGFRQLNIGFCKG
ncbi:MAG: hypothetical protein HOH19_03285 [Kordiimonadaceae bacterium]|jgi:hypothetical protein|nr:hypothetical protein [Kordiimonadaceae bacterium]MBT6031574.1 hypothetical protein [Kordiimonadaceae bacterium]